MAHENGNYQSGLGTALRKVGLGTLRITAPIILIVLILFSKVSADPGELTMLGLNPGNLAASIYVPLRLSESPALVVALHGCTQRASDYDEETGWTSLSDEFGFILLFPEQKTENNTARCFNWMLPEDRVKGKGEPESIKQMIDAVIQRHHLDEKKVFVTGLSAGGAMASVMLAAYPETFSGGGIIAGIPYACVTDDTDFYSTYVYAPLCMSQGRGDSPVKNPSEWGDRVKNATKSNGPWPRVSIWQGSADRIVNPVNAVHLMEQWTGIHGIDRKADIDETVSGHKHKVYKDSAGNALVETYEIKDAGHAVPVDPNHGCGEDRIKAWSDVDLGNDYMIDAGICSSRLLLRFWGLDRVETQ